MALPAIWNGWVVWEGDELYQEFRLLHDDGTPEDLSVTPVAKAQLRAQYDDAEVMATFTAELLDQTVEETRGKISLFLPTSEADKLRAGTAYWDVQLERADGTGRRTRLAGRMRIKNEVTK